jgi:hypothetical protein
MLALTRQDSRFNLTPGAGIANPLNKTKLSLFSGLPSSSYFDRSNLKLGARGVALILGGDTRFFVSTFNVFVIDICMRSKYPSPAFTLLI